MYQVDQVLSKKQMSCNLLIVLSQGLVMHGEILLDAGIVVTHFIWLHPLFYSSLHG